jgi:hypothetical protein
LVPSEFQTDTPSDIVASGARLVSVIVTVPLAATVKTWFSDPSCATLPEKSSVTVAGADGDGAVAGVEEPQPAAAASAAATRKRSHPVRMF